MAVEVKMPQWAMTITEGTVTEWAKKPGDIILRDDVLCTIEAAKAIDELRSTVDGTLLKICVEEGETVPVFTTICLIGESGEVH